MARVLLVLAILAATIFCVIDCIKSEEHEVRNLPKIVWVLLILIAPIVGSAAWFIAGRPRRERQVTGPPRVAPPRRPSGPDDDPMFLAGLDRTNAERRKLEAWERELEARERELERATGADEETEPHDRREPEGPGDEPANRS